MEKTKGADFLKFQSQPWSKLNGRIIYYYTMKLISDIIAALSTQMPCEKLTDQRVTNSGHFNIFIIFQESSYVGHLIATFNASLFFDYNRRSVLFQFYFINLWLS